MCSSLSRFMSSAASGLVDLPGNGKSKEGEVTGVVYYRRLRGQRERGVLHQ